MSEELSINVSFEQPRAVLALHGTLDSETIASLVNVLAHLDGTVGTVQLDLAELDNLDLSAAHTLTVLRDEFGVRLQRLELVNASGGPARVLELADVEAEPSTR